MMIKHFIYIVNKTYEVFRLRINYASLKTTSKGFTLAEVLITLAVIGVVAAMSIPSLMNATNDSEQIALLKETYVNLEQATQLIRQENGGTLVSAFENVGDVNNKYEEKLNHTQVCSTSPFGKCWSDYEEFFYSSGVPVLSTGGGAWGYRYSLILANGAFIRMAHTGTLSTSCQANSGGDIEYCFIIAFDTNGFKGPNTMGKDIFFVYVTKDGLKPFGALGDTKTVCPATGYGYSACTAKMLLK